MEDMYMHICTPCHAHLHVLLCLTKVNILELFFIHLHVPALGILHCLLLFFRANYGRRLATYLRRMCTLSEGEHAQLS